MNREQEALSRILKNLKEIIEKEIDRTEEAYPDQAPAGWPCRIEWGFRRVLYRNGMVLTFEQIDDMYQQTVGKKKRK